VLTRNVDANELWQKTLDVSLDDGIGAAQIDFDFVPTGKALVVEHASVRFFNATVETQKPSAFFLQSGSSFQYFQFSNFVPNFFGFFGDVATKFYVFPNTNLKVKIARQDVTGLGSFEATVTGYLVNYP